MLQDPLLSISGESENDAYTDSEHYVLAIQKALG